MAGAFLDDGIYEPLRLRYSRKIFYAPTYEHAKSALEMFKREWGKKYPYSHWRRIRTTNLTMEERALTMVYWQMKELRRIAA